MAESDVPRKESGAWDGVSAPWATGSSFFRPSSAQEAVALDRAAPHDGYKRKRESSPRASACGPCADDDPDTGLAGSSM